MVCCTLSPIDFLIEATYSKELKLHHYRDLIFYIGFFFLEMANWRIRWRLDGKDYYVVKNTHLDLKKRIK